MHLLDSFRVRAIASSALLLALCLACNTLNVQQSSLVPAPTLPPLPAHEGEFDAYVGSSTVTGVARPDLAPTESGLWVPRTQLDGAITWRPYRRFAMRGNWMMGFAADAQKVAPTVGPNPEQLLWGLGLGATYRFDDPGEPWFVDVSLDYLGLSVPSRVVITCMEPCLDMSVPKDQRDSVPLISAGAVAGYRARPDLALVLSTAVRNHPTNVANFASLTGDAEVRMGPANWLVGVGVQFRVTPWFALSPMVQVPLTANPVRYAPIVTLGVNFTAPDAPAGDAAEKR
jgi:hypothetical protein